MGKRARHVNDSKLCNEVVIRIARLGTTLPPVHPLSLLPGTLVACTSDWVVLRRVLQGDSDDTIN